MMAPGVDSATNKRRAFAFFVVVAVHVILIWGINAGLTDVIREKVLGNLQSVEIAAPKEEEEKPPPPPPKLETPPPFVPPPEISIEIPVVENSTAIQVVTQTRPVEAPPPVVERKSVETAPKINPRRPIGSSEEYYPVPSKRAGEEGSVTVQVDVNEEGRVVDARVLKTSGFPRLDEAALKFARTWRLLPATRDGKPVPGSMGMIVTFQLK